MPRVKWGIDPDEPEELEVFDVYDGPDIRRGVYDGVITRLQVKHNKNGEDMINGLVLVRDRDTEKMKFNGYPLWFNQNVTDQGKPFMLQWLKSMGLTWDDFMKRTVIEDDKERPTNILKIGRLKFNNGAEPSLRFSVGMSRANPEFPAKPEIKQFLPPKEEDDPWDGSDDDAGSTDEEENPFGN